MSDPTTPPLDLAELRRLAEAYAAAPESFAVFHEARWSYHAAVRDPATLLALLDRLAAAEEERNGLREKNARLLVVRERSDKALGDVIVDTEAERDNLRRLLALLYGVWRDRGWPNYPGVPEDAEEEIRAALKEDKG